MKKPLPYPPPDFERKYHEEGETGKSKVVEAMRKAGAEALSSPEQRLRDFHDAAFLEAFANIPPEYDSGKGIIKMDLIKQFRDHAIGWAELLPDYSLNHLGNSTRAAEFVISPQGQEAPVFASYMVYRSSDYEAPIIFFRQIPMTKGMSAILQAETIIGLVPMSGIPDDIGHNEGPDDGLKEHVKMRIANHMSSGAYYEALRTATQKYNAEEAAAIMMSTASDPNGIVKQCDRAVFGGLDPLSREEKAARIAMYGLALLSMPSHGEPTIEDSIQAINHMIEQTPDYPDEAF